MKRENKYSEYTEFENRLVIRLAGELSLRFRMSRQEQEDAEQEFAMRLWTKKAEYDESHPSCSSYEAFLTRYLEKCSIEVMKVVRAETYLDERGEPIAESLPFTVFDGRVVSAESIAIMRLQAQDALSKITPEQMELLKRVGRGDSVAAISADTGVSPKTIYSRIRSMRRVFRENGIDAANK
ncbi:MAG TPA: hypothetical protein PKH33_18540 [bacterium]|nr:hypothetical protein [bacterium]